MKDLLSVGGIVLLLDQISKWIVQTSMAEGETSAVWRDIWRITHIKNEGIALGFLQGQGLFLIVTGLVVIIAIPLFYRRLNHQDRWIRFGTGLLLGGAMGNFFDRLRLGGVIDFLDIGLGQYRWPVFNLADVSICLGVGILICRWIKKG
ncbi:TPA: signal peptidase II [bacterium]|nr:signal peptidase II [bacterium]